MMSKICGSAEITISINTGSVVDAAFQRISFFMKLLTINLEGKT